MAEEGTGVDDGQGRSGATTFVTVLGWALIGFTGLWALSMLLQTVMFTVMLAMPAPHATSDARTPSHLSLPFRMLLGLLVGVSVLVFASAIAFLKRKGWARRTFVTLFALAIVFNVAALLLLLVGGSQSVSLALGAGERFEPMARRMLVPTSIAAVALSLLFGWLIKRLTSAVVRAEFDDRAAY
jgi:hypothetical protein